MKYHNKTIFEIIFFARGGQGAKTAAEIIAQAALVEGKFVQSFPSFGPERSGAPTKTYVRISNSEIRTHEPVTDPDVVVVLDETLLDGTVVTEGLDKNEALIINSKKTVEEIKNIIKFEGKIYPVDANRISMEIVGQPRPNTVILGKFIKVTEITKLESVVEEFRHIFEAKIGKEATDKNISAIEKAYDSV
ncbi:MAG TPA: 2-oxoacid:acceptor oxidoreductase family protein [Candidatus Moranbacteria bacterium]|nr:2-oxoacid:acceptor oxidoreductase family protein [Candidatus Moranbacteria bacterium]